MLYRLSLATLLLPLLFAVSACGGGGEDSSDVDLLLDGPRDADTELALLIDLARNLEAEHARELVDDFVFDLQRVDPADQFGGDMEDGFASLSDLFGATGDPERDDGLPGGAPPSGWGIGGLSSAETTVRTDNYGNVTKVTTWTKTLSSGEVITQTYTSTANEDNSYRTSEYTSSSSTGGEHAVVPGRHTITRGKQSDGSAYEIITLEDEAGNGSRWHWNRPSVDGDIDHATEPMVGGYADDDNYQGGLPYEPGDVPVWMTRNPGDDGTVWWQQQLADWMWRQHKLGRHTPDGRPLDPNRVAPVDTEVLVGTGPTVWDLLDGEDLVVNPDPDAAHRVHMPSARAARILRERLRGLSNGVTPGPRPAPSEGT